jgi:hypothetical protein
VRVVLGLLRVDHFMLLDPAGREPA